VETAPPEGMEAPVLLALPLLLEGAFVVVVEGAGAEGRELLDWEAVWDEVWDGPCPARNCSVYRAFVLMPPCNFQPSATRLLWNFLKSDLH
jgi:hypothetical protein